MKVARPASKQPIPPNARRVFKGKIFDVYQWQQKLFDGTILTFEKIKRTDSVNVFPITKEKKIILTEQEQPGGKPFIGALGGRIDANESPLEAAKRELLEEAGYQAKKYILWDATQLLEKIDWAVYSFIAKNCKKIKKSHIDAGEKIKLIYVTFEEFLDLVAQENYRDVEIALKSFRLIKEPKKLEETRKLFTGSS